MYTRRELMLASLATLAAARIARTDDSSGPGPRAGHAMAWHAEAGAVCLVGGDRANLTVPGPREDVWLWQGGRWQKAVTSGEAPPAATLMAAAADQEQGSVLAYGGFRIEGPRKYGAAAGELWEIGRGLAWRRHDAPGPGPRHHHAMAFDTTRGRLVLYGGFDAANAWPTDIWEWDRARWHRIEVAAGPGPRAHHALAFDSRRGRVILRGGTTPSKVHPPDTWEWDGAAWHLAASDGPLPNGGYRLAYDASRGVTVLCGGDTCLWDGSTWTRAATTTAPASRVVHAMAYDAARHVVVLYGGSVSGKNLADTWEWNGTTWTLAG